MAWFDFTCRSGGSDMNPGTTFGSGEEPTTPAFTFTNGAWDGTTVFTCAGAPDLSGVAVNSMVTLAPDADTVPTSNQYSHARISAVDNGAKTITLTNINNFGTIQGVAAAGKTLRVGGAMQGPNGTSSWPLNFGLSVGNSTNPGRVNLKNDATYSVTATIAFSASSNLLRVQGYTSTFGDGGKFILDGGTSGASYNLLAMSVAKSELYDAEIRNNGATGGAVGIAVTGALCDLFRVTVHDVRGNGINQSSGRSVLTECLAYACNQSNGSLQGGIVQGTSSIPCMYVRVVSRDNVGSNNIGLFLNTQGLYAARDCVIESNGGIGLNFVGTSGPLILTGCDFYANGGDGFRFSASSGTKPVFLTDCNFVANGGYGVNGTGAGTAMGLLQNCGFGSGTAANTSGATNSLGDTVVSGSITYAANATPWVDPAATDFSPNASAAARGTGITAGSTTSRPDRAAAQAEAGSIAGAGSTGVVSSGF